MRGAGRAENRGVQTAVQQRRIAEARRRREAAAMLRIVASTAEYAAGQLSNGLGPAEARRAAAEVAGELESAAGTLRRLVRLTLAERRAAARMLASAGVSRREIARRLGVSERSAWRYTGHP
jgi:DNA-binding CsgD family transcriptional regulator